MQNHVIKSQYFMFELGGYDRVGKPFAAAGNTSFVKFDRRWSFDRVIDTAIELGMQRKYRGIIVFEGPCTCERNKSRIVYTRQFE